MTYEAPSDFWNNHRLVVCLQSCPKHRGTVAGPLVCGVFYAVLLSKPVGHEMLPLHNSCALIATELATSMIWRRRFGSLVAVSTMTFLLIGIHC